MLRQAFSKFLISIFSSLLLLAGCSYSLCQEETDVKPVLQRWSRNERLPSGVISLTTLRKATKFDGSEENVNVSFLDLDGRGQKELAIQSGCAAVGNCGLEIYMKVGKSYRRLLTTDMVQTIRPLSTTTHGYRDLELSTHGSAYESYHRVFKFNGARYKRNRCWYESYLYLDKKGNQHFLKKPIVTRGCGEEY